jgi:prevent-host-death family protein
MYNRKMAKHVVDMSKAEAARDFASLLAPVRAGAEVVIKNGTLPAAVVMSVSLRLLLQFLREISG